MTTRHALASAAGSPIPELVPTPLWAQLRWFERLGLWLLAEERRVEMTERSARYTDSLIASKLRMRIL